MKPLLLTAALLICPVMLRGEDKPANATSGNNDRLRQGLERHPEADTNRDGVLTMQEARTFLAKLKGADPEDAARPGKRSGTDGPAPPPDKPQNLREFLFRHLGVQSPGTPAPTGP